MSFTYYRSVTIDHTKCGTADSTDFPVLFNTTNATFKTVGNGGHIQNANGYDMGFFTDSGLTNAIAFEIDYYNASTGQIVAWVKIGTLNHSSDVVIYIGYGDSGVSTNPSSTSTWESNFKNVYHFGDGSTLSANDSTSNAYNLSVGAGTPTASTGKIAGAAHFDGSSYYQNTSHPTVPAGNSITVSMWAKANDQTTSAWSIGNDTGINRIQSHLPYSHTVYFDYGNGTLGQGRVSADYTSYEGAFTLLHFLFDSGSSDHEIFANGSSIAQGTNSLAPLLDQSGLYVGAWPINSLIWTGDADEYRVALTARSTSWITAEYNNQNAPGSFYTLGSEIGGSASFIAPAPFMINQAVRRAAFW